MNGFLKEENHSLSQKNTSNRLGNGLKEEGSFVLKSGLHLQFDSIKSMLF